MERLVLQVYDPLIGLELGDIAVDECITKAPRVGELAWPSPVDRGTATVVVDIAPTPFESGQTGQFGLSPRKVRQNDHEPRHPRAACGPARTARVTCAGPSSPAYGRLALRGSLPDVPTEPGALLLLAVVIAPGVVITKIVRCERPQRVVLDDLAFHDVL